VSAVSAIAALDSVGSLQRVLYRTAKAQPSRKFHALADKVHRRDVLRRAWVDVASNGGAAGVDGVTITDIEEAGVAGFLDVLHVELAEGRWCPTPVRRVEIPKPDGTTRPLGIPTVRDRVVQAALKIVLEPIFEADFQPCSFGFRPKRSAHHALNTIMDAAWDGHRVVVEADITKFFDNVDHDRLLAMVRQRVIDRKILGWLAAILRAGICTGDELLSSDTGTPQGGVISPLLANVYLNRLDRHWQTRHRGLGQLVRYADDLVIMCRWRSQANRALAVLEHELDDLGLRLHPDKTTIVNLVNGEGFDFLGFHHHWAKAPGRNLWFLARWPSKRAMARARQRIRELTARRLVGAPVASIIGRLNRFLAGWAGYFRHGNSARSFDKLQAHAKTRIAIFLGIKHQRGRWWGQRIVYSHPTELGLYQLVGTVKAPRPHQWRHQPRRAG
jgi:RNA-directed DNA polymerase